VRRVASVHPIHALWHANQPERDGTPQADGPQRVLVWRSGAAVSARVVDDVEWEFLEALGNGASLAACQELFGDEPGRLTPMLSRYALEGVIGGFRSATGE
jgi:hypothetical protein